MKYLITGCYGFVGTYLVRELARRDPDAQVVAIDRDRAPPQFPAVAASHQLDMLDLEACAGVIRNEQPDHLIHLASFSSVGFSWHDPIASFSNNTNIFLNVLECVRRFSPRTRVLSVGSSEEYGVVDPTALPLQETSPLAPASPYAVARVAQEQLGDVYVRGYGLNLVATRSFNHVGAGQSNQFVVSALGKQFAELARGERDHLAVGNTSVVRDFLDVRDVVTAYVLLLERGERGEVYNVCSGRGTSVAGVIDIFQQITGISPRIVTDPRLMRPVENPVVIGDHGKLARALGWQPSHSLKEALRSVYDAWYRQP